MGDRRESRARRYAQDHGAIGIAWMLVEAEDQVAALEARVARLRAAGKAASAYRGCEIALNSAIGATLRLIVEKDIAEARANLDEAIAACRAAGDLPDEDGT